MATSKKKVTPARKTTTTRKRTRTVKKEVPVVVEKAQAVSKIHPESKDIINKYSTFSFGAGLIPVPALDVVGLTAVQLTMVRKLFKLYHPNKNFRGETGKVAVSTLISTLAPHSIAGGRIGSLVKAIPVVGTVAGTLTFPVFATASTRTLGNVFNEHFAQGGGVVDFNPAKWGKELLSGFNIPKLF